MQMRKVPKALDIPIQDLHCQQSIPNKLTKIKLPLPLHRQRMSSFTDYRPSFQGCKSYFLVLYLASIWRIWIESNMRIFQSSPLNIHESSLFNAFYWYKHITPFNNYSLNSLVTNQRNLLQSHGWARLLYHLIELMKLFQSKKLKI